VSEAVSSETSAGRMLPVTTTSDEARRLFTAGRHHAFHYQALQAQHHLDAALAADPHFVLAYLHRGGMSSPEERGPFFEQARAHRERVTEDESRMVDAFHAFLWDRRVEDAVAIFSELADRYPDDPYLPTYLGLRYLHDLGQLDAAKEQFERARHRDPTFSQAAFWLGEVALRDGDHGRAEERFTTYAELASDQPRPYDCLGRLHLRQGRLDEAERWFSAALERDPGFVDSRQNLAWTRVERAQRALEDVLRGGDLDAVPRLYTASTRVTTPLGERLEGPGAVAAFWARTLEPSTSVALETAEVYLGAEEHFATQVASYRIESGGSIADAGTAITVWARTVEGWKIHRSVWASEAGAGG
jgi:tetratricopeptide (TPR) repeat protein